MKEILYIAILLYRIRRAEVSMSAIKSRLPMSMSTGSEVPVDAAPNSSVPMTSVIKICLSMSISPISIQRLNC